jgi:hypothetical protein
MGTGVAIIWGQYKISETFKVSGVQESFKNAGLCYQTSPYIKESLKVAVEFCR